MTRPPTLPLTTPQLIGRARALITPGRRRLLGITGSPGAGKSTLSEALLSGLGDAAALVPMDGFHLAGAELERLGRRGRKGAPDTFDAAGYAALLDRLRRGEEGTVYAPRFDRALEESIGSAIPVPAGTPLILTEGNYLLLEGDPWSRVRAALDEVWFLEVPEDLRVDRLVRRHEAFGKPPQEATRWAREVDGGNAELIARTRARADLVVQWIGAAPG